MVKYALFNMKDFVSNIANTRLNMKLFIMNDIIAKSTL